MRHARRAYCRFLAIAKRKIVVMTRSERHPTCCKPCAATGGRVSAGAGALTGVSRHTVYRDIASLQAEGAEIDGEPGVGSVN